MWSQTADDVTEDSLAGFDLGVALAQTGEADEAYEANNQIRIAQRDYIDQKYHLGKYAPDYQYPGKVYNNAVFPVSSCTNVDFETGDFTGWSGQIGDNTGGCYSPFTSPQNGIFSSGVDAPVSNSAARHTIITPAFGNDPYGGFPGVPSGSGGFTARMGGQTPNYQGEKLEQTFTVSPTSTSFAYRYAVVFNDPPFGHPPTAKPYFRIEVLDQNGQPISNCTQFFDTSHVNSPGFFLSPQAAPNGDPVYYKPWTTVNFDLTGFVGQNVTIRFTVAGCTQSGHFGYAYIDCSCSALAASINFCPGNTFLYLGAPDGYAAYQWLDPQHNPIPGATNDTLLVNNPVVGDTFFVYLTSAADTSCHNTLPVVLEYTHIFPNATATNASCFGYKDGTLSASGTLGFPPYTYNWNTLPPQSGQSISNVGAGTYIVHMTDSLGCDAYDTTVITQPARIDTSLFTYAFCYGDPHITISAPPGFVQYTWIGPNGDTLSANPPNSVYVNGPQIGDEYTCILYPSTGCPVYDTVALNFNPPSIFFSADSTVNVFTPNGDGKNDYFYPYYDYTVATQASSPGGGQPAYDFFDLYIATYEIKVYNRWGQQVFYSNDYNYGWDGMIDKDKASEGVYYWIATYTTRCSQTPTPIVKTGFVHLIR
ncbi:MAG TPA: gliding motility-associated C-terminal domain-containing protein [Bacteroidia bacterium]|nr:gliding motility-associated C-terminal domain-containing protein [Bacteroidia bacterium]